MSTTSPREKVMLLRDEVYQLVSQRGFDEETRNSFEWTDKLLFELGDYEFAERALLSLKKRFGGEL